MAKIKDWNKVKMCLSHKPHKLRYLAFMEYADKMAKKGIDQKQCPVCLYWFFPKEY